MKLNLIYILGHALRWFSSAPRPETGNPVFGPVVGVPEPLVDMGMKIVLPTMVSLRLIQNIFTLL